MNKQGRKELVKRFIEMLNCEWDDVVEFNLKIELKKANGEILNYSYLGNEKSVTNMLTKNESQKIHDYINESIKDRGLNFMFEVYAKRKEGGWFFVGHNNILPDDYYLKKYRGKLYAYGKNNGLRYSISDMHINLINEKILNKQIY